MAPSSPSSAAPTRVSERKRAAKAEEVCQIQEDEEEALVASSAKRRRGTSAGTKPKSPAKQAKPPKAGRKKKAEAERTEPVEDDVCAEEPDEEEMAMGEQEAAEAEAEEQEASAAAPAGSPGKKRVAQPRKRGAIAAGDHEPEFVGEPVPAAEARTKWPKRYDRSAAAKRYTPPSLLCFVFSFGPNSFAPLLLIRRACRPEEDEELKARCHYRSAKVDNVVYSLDDDVYVKVIVRPLHYLLFSLCCCCCCARVLVKEALLIVNSRWCDVMICV